MAQINSLKTETKFKKTEIGEIPVDWEKVQLKNVVKDFINGGTPDTKNPPYWDGNIPWVTGADFENQKIRNIRRYITDEGVKNSATNIIPKDNLLVVTRTGVGKLAIAPFDIAISQDITGVIPYEDKISVNYLFWHLDYHSWRLKGLIQGTSINGILRDDLSSFVIALPPLPEQKKIAEILSTVDEAIEKKKEVIEKTRELKKGIMQELLTRGIGHKKLKMTEFGTIPQEWDIEKVKDICNKPQYGFTASATDKPVGPKFLRITDIQDGNVNWENVPYCRCPDSLTDDYLLKTGDILFARTGATTGKSLIIKNCPKAIFASYLIRITTRERIIPDFLYHVFNSFIYWKQINQQIGGSAQGGVNATSLSLIRIPLPSFAEQKKIAKILHEMGKQINSEIDLLKELSRIKKGLMNDLLQGKIRVKCKRRVLYFFS